MRTRTVNSYLPGIGRVQSGTESNLSPWFKEFCTLPFMTSRDFLLLYFRSY